MIPKIDAVRTGQKIRLLMKERGVTVRDVRDALMLSCVQSVYHWLDGKSLPSLDNLYALSELLRVPMDMMVCGSRRYQPEEYFHDMARRLLRYYRGCHNGTAA